MQSADDIDTGRGRFAHDLPPGFRDGAAHGGDTDYQAAGALPGRRVDIEVRYPEIDRML